jgi:hypothetical protein
MTVELEKQIIFERGVDKDNNVVEVVGTLFYRTSNTGFADSVAAVQGSSLQRAPTYMFAQARATAKKSDPVWSVWNDTNAEVDTVLDEKGSLGEAGKLYVVDFQRGGIFVNDHSRVRSAVTEKRLRNGAMPLDQKEVNDLLSYIANGDVPALVQKGWLQGSGDANYIFKNVSEFVEASDVDGFLRNTPGYVVVTSVENAQAESKGYQANFEQLHNPRLMIRSGGKAALKGMLDQALFFGWSQFGSWTDGYKNPNSGRAVVLNYDNLGVGDDDNLNSNGRSIGVAPKALEARAKIVGPVPAQAVEVQPSINQILAASSDFVPKICWDQYENSMKNLYGIKK